MEVRWKWYLCLRKYSYTHERSAVLICVFSGHVCSWPSGHCLLGKSGSSCRPVCEQQLISSGQSCPHSQPPPSPERKINCTHAVNKNKKMHCDKVTQPLQIPHKKGTGGWSVCCVCFHGNLLMCWAVTGYQAVV